jgi:hypothetical protein
MNSIAFKESITPQIPNTPNSPNQRLKKAIVSSLTIWFLEKVPVRSLPAPAVSIGSQLNNTTDQQSSFMIPNRPKASQKHKSVLRNFPNSTIVKIFPKIQFRAIRNCQEKDINFSVKVVNKATKNLGLLMRGHKKMEKFTKMTAECSAMHKVRLQW